MVVDFGYSADWPVSGLRRYSAPLAKISLADATAHLKDLVLGFFELRQELGQAHCRPSQL